MSNCEIDPDIRRARTLASEFYTGTEYFDQSKEKIFARTWQLVGREDDVDTLKPITLLPGFLDEPLLLVRSGDQLTCLSNVCTHRGKILVEEPCRASLIRCGYHGRRFALDGKFLSMPEFEEVENFPCEDDDLRQIPILRKAGFIFTSLDPISSFDAFYDDAAVKFGDIQTSGLQLAATREYAINAHWALYCENYLEGFHIPFVHRTLNEIVDYASYSTDLFRYSSLQTGYDSAGNIAARYLFIFPNLMLNLYEWGISVNIVRPVSPSRTVVEFQTYVRDGAEINAGAGADLHAVEMEDERVVESVQRGIRSRFYSHGRYSPCREQGTHHFHRLIADFLR